VAMQRIFDAAARETEAHQLEVPANECRRPEHHHPVDRPVKLRKIMVYVHGGLNGHDFALSTARDTLSAIAREPKSRAWTFPICVHWPSDGLSCYGERAFLLRNGSHYPFWGKVTSPVFVGFDLARGAISLPIDAFYMLATDLQVGFKVGFDADVLKSSE